MKVVESVCFIHQQKWCDECAWSPLSFPFQMNFDFICDTYISSSDKQVPSSRHLHRSILKLRKLVHLISPTISRSQLRPSAPFCSDVLRVTGHLSDLIPTPLNPTARITFCGWLITIDCERSKASGRSLLA